MNDTGDLEDELDLEPIDWEHLRMAARLSPGQRMMAMAQTSAFARAMLRGAFRRRHPDLSIEAINRMMFRYIHGITLPERDDEQ